MSSIFELFGDPALEGEGGDAPFDTSRLDSILDEAIRTRPVAGRPTGFDPDGPGSPVPSSDGEVHGTEGEDTGTLASVPPETPTSPPPIPDQPASEPSQPLSPAPADPFAGLTDLERQELLAVRQALADPERSDRIKRAYLGIADTPAEVSATPAPPPPAPTLPEDIDPGSTEALLWQQNQAIMREIGEIKAGQAQNQQLTEQERINTAAQRATQEFAARYGTRLSADEIAAVCQLAGMQKLPEAFRPVSQSWDEAMDKALEFQLRSNDVLLAKVLGATAPPATPAGGGPSPETVHTRRQLTALSSAASPSGETAQRVPLEHRGDGKLTEKSRIALVQELMNGHLTGSPGEGI